jgi:hypothetical protein
VIVSPKGTGTKLCTWFGKFLSLTVFIESAWSHFDFLNWHFIITESCDSPLFILRIRVAI